MASLGQFLSRSPQQNMGIADILARGQQRAQRIGQASLNTGLIEAQAGMRKKKEKEANQKGSAEMLGTLLGAAIGAMTGGGLTAMSMGSKLGGAAGGAVSGTPAGTPSSQSAGNIQGSLDLMNMFGGGGVEKAVEEGQKNTLFDNEDQIRQLWNQGKAKALGVPSVPLQARPPIQPNKFFDLLKATSQGVGIAPSPEIQKMKQISRLASADRRKADRALQGEKDLLKLKYDLEGDKKTGIRNLGDMGKNAQTIYSKLASGLDPSEAKEQIRELANASEAELKKNGISLAERTAIIKVLKGGNLMQQMFEYKLSGGK